MNTYQPAPNLTFEKPPQTPNLPPELLDSGFEMTELLSDD
jgi:hypothetical protein